MQGTTNIEQRIEIEVGDSDSERVGVCLTVRNRDSGKRARCWLSASLRPNGRLRFILHTLGKTKEGDRDVSREAAWHDDLK